MINIKRLLYSLKKYYGTPVDFYREYDSQPDIETGVINQYRKKFHIDRAVYLNQTTILRSPLTHVLGQLTGVMQIANTMLVLSIDDFYEDFKPHLKDYLIIDHRRYEITDIEQIDQYESICLLIKEYKGSVLYEQHEPWLKDKLTIIELLSVDKTHVYTEYLSDSLSFSEQLINDYTINNLSVINISDTLNFIDTVNSNYQPIQGGTYTRHINDLIQLHETLIVEKN